jgi:hypothetical protein
MWRHIYSKVKWKRKQGEGSSSSSQAQSNTSTSLFALIVLFPFIFIYTCSFEFIVMFYLIYFMPLFVGNSSLSAVTGEASRGATSRGAALDSCTTDGRRDRATCSQGGGSHGVGHPQGARGPQGGSWGVGVVVIWWRWWGGCPAGGRLVAATTDPQQVSSIVILFRFNFVCSN